LIDNRAAGAGRLRMTQSDDRDTRPVPAGGQTARRALVGLLIGAILLLIVIAALTLH
jgi:hypothetical protein